jgi:hypothetical protein
MAKFRHEFDGLATSMQQPAMPVGTSLQDYLNDHDDALRGPVADGT